MVSPGYAILSVNGLSYIKIALTFANTKRRELQGRSTESGFFSKTGLLSQYLVPSRGCSFSGHLSKQLSVLGSFAARQAKQSEGCKGSAPGLRQPKTKKNYCYLAREMTEVILRISSV